MEWSLPRKKYSQEYLKIQSWDPCSFCHLFMTYRMLPPHLIVTPKYLALSTTSRVWPCRVYCVGMTCRWFVAILMTVHFCGVETHPRLHCRGEPLGLSTTTTRSEHLATWRIWYRTSAGNHFNKDDITTVSSSCSRSYMSVLPLWCKPQLWLVWCRLWGFSGWNPLSS
jgi:hypothetical protein